MQTEIRTEIQTERCTEMQTERLTETQTKRQTDIQTERPTDRQTERPTKRQTERQTDFVDNFSYRIAAFVYQLFSFSILSYFLEDLFIVITVIVLLM